MDAHGEAVGAVSLRSYIADVLSMHTCVYVTNFSPSAYCSEPTEKTVMSDHDRESHHPLDVFDASFSSFPAVHSSFKVSTVWTSGVVVYPLFGPDQPMGYLSCW